MSGRVDPPGPESGLPRSAPGRPPTWTRGLLVIAVALVLTGLAPVLGYGAGGSGRPSPAPVGHGPAAAAPLVPGRPGTITIPIALSAQRRAIDLGGWLNLTATPSGNRRPTLSWSGLPPGCPPPGNSTRLACIPNATGSYNVTVRVRQSGFDGGAYLLVSVSPVPKVTVTVSPASGAAPVTVTLFANVTGGAPPLSISWIFSDGSIASGATVNHTFSDRGTYRINLWVNDSTSTFNPNGSWATVLTYSVQRSTTSAGLFGLPDHDGLYLLGVLGAGAVALGAYEYAMRRRPKPLPPAEPWMRPPEGPARAPPVPPGPGGTDPPRPPPSK